MTYDSLKTIPIVLFFEIAETGNFYLLSDTEKDPEKLEEIWLNLYKEHESYKRDSESDKIFKTNVEISALEIQYRFVLGAVYSLGFEYDQELIDQLKTFRFIVNTDSNESYYESLEFIQRAASGISVKINHLKSMLPKESESTNKSKETFSIYDTIASYTRIMEYDVDYESLTYLKFYAIQKQVHLKIESEIKKATINKIK